MLRDLHYALLGPRTENQLLKNPTSLKVILAISGFISSLLTGTLNLIIIIVLLLLISAKNRILSNIVKGLKASTRPLLILAFFSFIFYSVDYTIHLLIRLITIIIIINLFYLSIRPLEIAVFLERLGIPRTFTISLELSFKAIPIIIKDAEEALIALLLKGKFKRRSGVSQYLATILISANIRSYALAEYMASRFYGATRRRTTPYKYEINATSFLLLLGIAWSFVSIPLVFNSLLNIIQSLLLL